MRLILIGLLVTCNVFSQSKVVVKASGTSVLSSGTASYNILSYGAVSGAANNTTAIQAAINAAHAAGGGIVYFPAGTYNTNQIETYTDVTIKGDGYVSSFIKSISADTLFAIHNLAPALAGVPYSSNTNTLIEDVYLQGNSIGKIGFYANRAANFRIGRIFIENFTSKGLVLHNSLIGNVNGCYINNNPYGIHAFADGSNSTATTDVSINECVIYRATKWAIDWSGGGQIFVKNVDFELNGSSDTLTGCIYYHANNWPGGLHVVGGWAEENLGSVLYIDANVTPTTVAFATYPPTTTHSISDFQDLGQHYGFTKRNICIRGANQRLGIINSSITGAVNNVIADGTNNIVTVLNSTFDAANTNLTRNGATIVTK